MSQCTVHCALCNLNTIKQHEPSATTLRRVKSPHMKADTKPCMGDMWHLFTTNQHEACCPPDNLTMLNEVFLLLALSGFEAARLYLGQEENIHKKISVVFRILVLTVPASYLTLYFTFWQTKVTQVDAVLGIILLIFQFIQLCCAFLTCLPNRGRICFNPFETDWDKLN